MKRIGLLLGLTVLLVGCSTEGEVSEDGVDRNDAVEVTMTMETGGEVEMHLYPNNAPETVDNFVSLVEDGFYDGLTFHRIVPGFMVQGGDPDGTGMGGSPETITGEFASNEIENPLDHQEGVLSMARVQGDHNSASSQFFIMLGEHASLDGDYAAFGEVVDGMDVVEEIAQSETTGEMAVDPPVIASMEVN
ncbi:peptidylprolyl isomerase [Geomicrobium sp. JSM 1781026]|uniref:peptidylprolyl isomerase n=1 Tax=Geomicrobium sp. JSM 1781026 TaxID=3344580 RepID=UPI0035BF893E